MAHPRRPGRFAVDRSRGRLSSRLGFRACQHCRMATGLNDDEAMLVETVRQFVDKEVRPTVREREHANEYPEAWIEQMKRIGI
jgi:alkylation response protein AidB-like acyl-CoA dehydrogenase